MSIIEFYKSSKFDEILSMNHEDLENKHDYIQLLFPIDTLSIYNPDAPLITQDVIDKFIESPYLQFLMIRALSMMLNFYGLQLLQIKKTPINKIIIVKGRNFNQRSKIWMRPGNHNYKRLTRIMRSLKLVGLYHYSEALRNTLLSLDDINDNQARDFWLKS